LTLKTNTENQGPSAEYQASSTEYRAPSTEHQAPIFVPLPKSPFMSLIRISKEFTFEAAHALKGYDGPCKNIHGHSYELTVTVIGEPNNEDGHPKMGMVMDFGDLKRIIKKNIVDPFDHALILSSSYEKEVETLSKVFCENIVTVDYQPTSENILADFADRIKALLPSNLKLNYLKLRETGNSYAEWFAEDQEN
jgi:6-pyruvoyltetrahydropterin/6-carboxytetrahydropterin synthase